MRSRYSRTASDWCSNTRSLAFGSG